MDKKLPEQLNKYKIKISKIDFNSNNFRIESDDGIIFVTPIKKGSIQCKIFNESNQEVNLSSIEENSLVIIIGSTNSQVIKETKISDKQKLYNYLVNNESDKSENKEKNIIVIRKIIVKNNYMFNSDSSEEFNEFD
jgi:hypothetical protein